MTEMPIADCQLVLVAHNYALKDKRTARMFSFLGLAHNVITPEQIAADTAMPHEWRGETGFDDVVTRPASRLTLLSDIHAIHMDGRPSGFYTRILHPKVGETTFRGGYEIRQQQKMLRAETVHGRTAEEVKERVERSFLKDVQGLDLGNIRVSFVDQYVLAPQLRT